jgi:hypothetical protein
MDNENAALYYEKALDLAPSDTHYVYQLIATYLEAGDHAMLRHRVHEWMPLLEQFLERFPDTPDFLLQRLILLIETKGREEWLIDLEDVSENHHLEPHVRMWLGEILSHFDTNLAVEQMRRAIAEGCTIEEYQLEEAPLPEAFRISPEYILLLNEFGRGMEMTNV